MFAIVTPIGDKSIKVASYDLITYKGSQREYLVNMIIILMMTLKMNEVDQTGMDVTKQDVNRPRTKKI